MTMIVVDPELFVTCRLCLQDKGSYQIVPAVIQQIKYCFDINVDPFDGLPQLLCTKCESILSDHFKTKKLFIEKQNYLINRLHGRNDSPLVSQQETVSSSQQNEENIKRRSAKKRRVNISPASSIADSEKATSLIHNDIDKPTISEKSLTSWKIGYKKQYLCRMCKASRTERSAVLRHVRIHENLKEKYANVFKKYCTVQLNRLNDEPNITGTKNSVVYSKEKIIQGGNLNYFVLYSKLTTNIRDSVSMSEDELHDSQAVVKKLKKDYDSSDSSDQVVISSRKKRRRVLSRSSNETVVIGTNSRYDSSDSEEEPKAKSVVECRGTESIQSNCISIEDSSDSMSNEDHINLRSKSQRQSVKVDYKTIHNIVSMCRKNYLKKYDCDNNNKNKHTASTESQLKHKILSIGMKIINKQGFNCTGLLRFMEHKNLDIVWLVNVNKELNYVRIVTKLKQEECKKSDIGWKYISDLKNIELYSPKSHSEKDNNLTSNLSTITRNLNENDVAIETDRAVLYNICTTEIKNKLLNANPVANPKQLPKKAVVNEKINFNIKTIDTNINVSNVGTDESVSTDIPAEITDIRLCMPIITSTESLATNVTRNRKDKENDGKDPIDVDAQKSLAKQSVSDISTPRIKVKPASELMSERVLNYNNLLKEPIPFVDNAHERQIPLPYENLINIYIPKVTFTQIQAIGHSTGIVEKPSSSSISNEDVSSGSSLSTCDYVILNTPELPNTKTESPFKYFAKLLQIHNIILLETNHILQNFICLIKFKVLFKQETKDQPVILCLSLFCLANTFCLMIKNRNQENINVDKVSANWQWEILKIYMGDVVSKILQNARRVSQEVYEYTNNFLRLLKSIEYKKIHESI